MLIIKKLPCIIVLTKLLILLTNLQHDFFDCDKYVCTY